MTNEEIIQRGQLINDETEPAQNTSERVGGVIKGIGQNLADKDTAIEAQAARNGYYQCTVNSNQLAVTAPGFTLPAHGGNIRIKMSAPATGASTLNINSTGPKALLYNGAALSSANTWEQNEIISVFYDPSGSGQYLASNSQGGGGKAEKIKYDNSQSGLSAENVQGAIDENVERIKDTEDAAFVKNEINISLGTIIKGYWTFTDGQIKAVDGSTTFRRVAPIDVTQYYSVKLQFYLLSSYVAYTFFANDNGDIIGGYLINSSGGFVEYVVPKGATKLYFCTRYASQTAFAAKGVTRETLASKVESTKTDLENEIDDVKSESVIGYETLYDPYLGSKNYGFVQSDGSIITGSSGSPYRYTGYIEVHEGDVICIHSNIRDTPVALLAAYDSSKAYIQDSCIMSDGSGNQDLIYKVPSGVAYLRLSCNISASGYSARIQIDNSIFLSDGLYEVKTIQPDYEGNGYVSLEGVIVTQSSTTWAYTGLMNVNEGEEVYFRTTNSNSSCMLASYTKSNLITATDIIAGPNDQYSPMWHKYIVPSGITQIRITHKYEVDGQLNVYIRRKIKERKKIRILWIGNSMTQDAVAYLPLLLRELAPDVEYELYDWYHGGWTLAQHLDSWNNGQTAQIFSICRDCVSWKNWNSRLTMDTVLSQYTFDIVVLQEYFNNMTAYSAANLQTFNDCISYIRDHYNKPFKVATFFHAPLRSAPDAKFNVAKDAVETIIKKTVAEFFNPCGIAVYRALSTDLDSLGDQGHLSPDGVHTQEGLPCMLQTYVTALWVMDMLGIPMSVIGANTEVTNNNYGGINVPGPNLGTGVVIGTQAQVRLSQDVAVKAFKEGEYIRNQALTEYT